jgi:hypothetical protein
MKLFTKKFKRPLAVDGVGPFEILDGYAVGYIQPLIELLHQHILRRNRFVRFNRIASIRVPVLGHVWPRSHQARHLGVIDHIDRARPSGRVCPDGVSISYLLSKGDQYRNLRQLERAEQEFQKILQCDHGNLEAKLGLQKTTADRDSN